MLTAHNTGDPLLFIVLINSCTPHQFTFIRKIKASHNLYPTPSNIGSNNMQHKKFLTYSIYFKKWLQNLKERKMKGWIHVDHCCVFSFFSNHYQMELNWESRNVSERKKDSPLCVSNKKEAKGGIGIHGSIFLTISCIFPPN